MNIKSGDVIIGKMTFTKYDQQKVIVASSCDEKQPRFELIADGDSIKVKMVGQQLKYHGDMISSRYAQKGVIG